MPAQIIAGDSLRLAVPSGDYPASAGWSVALVLTPLAGGTPTSIAGSEAGGEWVIALGSSASAELAAGRLRYLLAATKNGDRSTIDHGEVEVLANPADSETDLRSAAQRALDAIDAVLANRASSEDMEFTFEDGRALKKVPHADLLTLRRHYARIVARERGKGRGPKRVMVRL
jgi:hypothetical protein